MQSENFDKKIKDSLSQRPPESDTPDWDKMETLLDKHMPVKEKDRRRILLILFSFLFLGGGTLLVWQNNNNKKEVAEVKSPIQNSAAKENNKPGNTGIDKGTSTSQLPDKNTDRSASSPDPESKNKTIETNIIFDKEIKPDVSIAKAGKSKKINTSVNKKTNNSKQKKIRSNY